MTIKLIDQRHQIFSPDWFHVLLRRARNVPDDTEYSRRSELHKTAVRMAELVRKSLA